jgi:pantoate--beta-alanine ligase
MQKRSMRLHETGTRIGLVATMGALHEGHLSLFQAARKKADVVVVSIFVNPTQFGPAEDFHRYPRDPQGDQHKCQKAGVDILFMPTHSQMFSKDHSTVVTTQGLTDVLCGPFRPGHFQGVTTVVAQLFNIVRPHLAFFGQKDYQQTMVIRKMVKDLHWDIKIFTLPTVREPDGLPASSRNSYLTRQERQAAKILYASLLVGRTLILKGERDAFQIRSRMESFIKEESLVQVEYIAISHPQTLQEIQKIQGKTLLALAVWVGNTRLIDNLLVGPPSK